MSAAGDALVVRFPGDNLPERSYAVRSLLEGMLGLRIELWPDDRPDYRIELGGGARLVVRDAFFREHRPDGSYLDREFVPERAPRVALPPAPQADLVAIFGQDEYRETPAEIVCGVDLFASTFFMLTRWEEHVGAQLDAHARTPSSAQLAVRAGFELRPVVNEYAEALWAMLRALGYAGPRAERRTSLVVTHDVDRIYHRPPLAAVARSLRERAWKRAGVTAAYGALRVDPWATFEDMMSAAEARGQRSHFYFICGGATAKEGYYDLDDAFVRRLLDELVSRGHVVGLHPSYETYDDPTRWRAEKERLDALLPEPCTQGRQHYLRFRNPDTWRIWERAGMRVDSTMGFADRVGYRCGTGDEYTLFDVLERRPLELRERPLVLMDSALRGVEEPERDERIRALREATRRYRMPLTVLFHNHQLDPVPWNRAAALYRDLLEPARGEAE